MPSFLRELRKFYYESWKECHKYTDEDKLVTCLNNVAKKIGGLIQDYSLYLMGSYYPILKKFESTQRKPEGILAYINKIAEGNTIEAEAIGAISEVGKNNVLLYGYAPSYGRFFVFRIKTEDKFSFKNKILFKRIKITAKKGSLVFFFPMNKLYRHGRGSKVSINSLHPIAELPCLETKYIKYILEGLISPELLIQTIYYGQSKNYLIFGHLVITEKARQKDTLIGNKSKFIVGDSELVLDTSYGYADDQSEGCKVFIIFPKRLEEVSGYYLGCVKCSCKKFTPRFYFPTELIIRRTGKEIANIVQKAPSNYLNYFLPTNQEFNNIKAHAKNKREALVAFYNKYPSKLFFVPNLNYKRLESPRYKREFNVWKKHLNLGLDYLRESSKHSPKK
jgi:hypothetical protein